MDQRPDGLTEPLQTYCQKSYCARNVPGEGPQWRGFPYVHLNELPKQEMGCQLDFHGRVPRGDLIKVAGELAQKPVDVLPLLPRPERLSIVGRQTKTVNDPKREGG